MCVLGDFSTVMECYGLHHVCYERSRIVTYKLSRGLVGEDDGGGRRQRAAPAMSKDG